MLVALKQRTDHSDEIVKLKAEVARMRLDATAVPCDELRKVLANSVKAEHWRELSHTDASTTKFELAQALKWAEKESALATRELERSQAAAATCHALLKQTLASCAPKDGASATAAGASPPDSGALPEGFPHTGAQACPSGKWQLLEPSVDARFEGEEGLSPRLDGIPVDGVNISDVYKVHVCKRSANEGTMLVTKLKRCDETRKFTTDPTYSALAGEYGPDEFDLILEGPEMMNLRTGPGARHTGACKYELPYRVSVPGQYHVSLVVSRENYGGADEQSAAWPPSHYDEPLGTQVFLNFEGALRTDEEMKSLLEGGEGGGVQLPPCSLVPPPNASQTWYRSGPGDGRWVNGKSTGLFKHRDPVSHVPSYFFPKSTRLAIVRPWVVNSQYRWTPRKCRMQIFTPAQARTCMHGKSVHFRGDSHMRQLMNALSSYMCEQGTDQGIWHADFCVTPVGKCTAADQVDKVCMKNDADGDAPPAFADCSEDGSTCDLDLVVANFGQHPADGAHHWPNKRYRDQVDAYTQKLIAATPAHVLRRKFLWMESNAAIFRKDVWIRGYHDWRTNSRLWAMNKYASAKMREIGVGIIPTFAQTTPMAQLQMDQAHFDLVVLQKSAVQHVLNFLCPP